MLQGLYTAANGMMAAEMRQDIIANNVANANTPGFKRHSPVQIGFYDLLSGQLHSAKYYDRKHSPGGGVKNLESFPNLQGGALMSTGNPLDVAIQGPGYIAVATPRGERFTRNGEFTLDIQGDLVTAEGYKVQSVSGTPIAASGGPVVIGEDGSVTVNGATVGQIRMVEFEQPTRLLREGDNLFGGSKEILQSAAPAENTLLSQEHLEMSNVNVPQEMINMVLGLRAYEANQHVISAFDTTLERLIEQVGMPQ